MERRTKSDNGEANDCELFLDINDLIFPEGYNAETKTDRRKDCGSEGEVKSPAG